MLLEPGEADEESDRADRERKLGAGRYALSAQALEPGGQVGNDIVDRVPTGEVRLALERLVLEEDARLPAPFDGWVAVLVPAHAVVTQAIVELFQFGVRQQRVGARERGELGRRQLGPVQIFVGVPLASALTRVRKRTDGLYLSHARARAPADARGRPITAPDRVLARAAHHAERGVAAQTI